MCKLAVAGGGGGLKHRSGWLQSEEVFACEINLLSTFTFRLLFFSFFSGSEEKPGISSCFTSGGAMNDRSESFLSVTCGQQQRPLPKPNFGVAKESIALHRCVFSRFCARPTVGVHPHFGWG